ncbi:MAG: hypothetical protein CSA63_00780 [Propionibacterium sp.]|nr:MAG: hypothetical protein CSA63_00780 [Propionibacterium sp.]
MRNRLALLLITSLVFFAFPWNASTAHAEDPGPLVLVFDTSGSMGDEDRNGRIKIKVAQDALSDLVAHQPGQAELGLWTYPGTQTNVSECPSGGWYSNLSPDHHPDPTDVNAMIRMLTADGGTPTGPALQAASDSMRNLGYNNGTILLVSDGESNCGPPPCEVAKQIIASGFDVVVNTISFDLETNGREELECIANVTGGSHTQVEDAAELAEQLAQYQRADLELVVNAPKKVRAGSTVDFDVELTNPSQQPVSDLAATITVDKDFVPYMPKPYVRLGNIAPGGTTTHQWITGLKTDKTGVLHWRVIVGSPATGAVVQEGDIEVVDSNLARKDGGPLLQPAGGVAVVLGDSYSSGEGAGDYIMAGGPCHRSPHTYGAVIGGPTTEIIACSGAETQHILDTDQHIFDSQLEQLEKVDVIPDIVFLTIGGNDIGFATIVAGCIIGDCSKNPEVYLYNIKGRAKRLAEVYVAIAKKINTPEMLEARNGKIAPVVVSFYPQPFWSPERGRCNFFFNRNEILTGTAILSELNGQITTGVKRAQQEGWPVYYADTVGDFATGHSMCVDDSYFVRANVEELLNVIDVQGKRIDHDELQEIAHPNAAGYRAWANELILWSQTTKATLPTTLPRQEPARAITEALREIAEEWLTQPISPKNVAVSLTLNTPQEDGTFTKTETTITANPGSKVDIEITGMAPGSKVSIVLRSDPITLGSLVADEDGRVVGTVTLPRDTPAGAHTLTAWGNSSDFNLVGKTVDLDIRHAVPMWLLVVAGAAVLSLLLAGVSFLVRRSRKKQA